jgi:hypothetical protein
MMAVVVDAEVDEAARDKALQGHPGLDPALVEHSLKGLWNGYEPTAGSRSWVVLSRWTSGTS